MKYQTVNFISLGCAKNLVDSEVLMAQLKNAGFVVNFDQESRKADLAIVNTCGFINDAKEESVDTILSLVNQKQNGSIGKVVVMGCLTERYRSELAREIPEVDGWFGVNQIPELLKMLGANYKYDLHNERVLTTPSHFAYLKISEGCNRTCSFCAIPMIRGKHISRSIEDIVEEAGILAQKGVKELLLIAQDLTFYGLDLYQKRALAKLLLELVKIDGIEWIRLHYFYPAQFPCDVLDVMAENPKICKYIDLPLQHINSKILNSMNRGINREETIQLIETIRSKVPGVALRTTLIVGYPGEGEKEFNEIRQFITQTKFDRLGIFTYSPEKGTTAYQLKNPVSGAKKIKRLEELMTIQQEISLEKNHAKVGSIFKVIVDREENDYYIGRTEFDSPEVDNEVLISKNIVLTPGRFYDVTISNADEFDLFGEIHN